MNPEVAAAIQTIEAHLIAIEDAGKRGENRAGHEYALLQKSGLFAAVRAADPGYYAILTGRVIKASSGVVLREIEKRAGNSEDHDPAAPSGIEVIDAADFLANFSPPEDIWTGVLRRAYAYAFTSPTNGGKTAVGCHIVPRFAFGLAIAGIPVEAMNVAYFAGENPHDVKPRLIAECQLLGIDPERLRGRVRIIPSAFPLLPNIEAMRSGLCDFPIGLAFVDTSAAYYHGEEINDNVAQRDHALALRTITTFTGNPTVVAPAHPIKNATRENLEPMGGSAFLNELDGNLTCWNEGSAITLGWHKKLRQPGFEPIQFALRVVEVNGVRYRDGRPYSTVALAHVSQDEAQQMEQSVVEYENRLLYALLRHPKQTETIRNWAEVAKVPVGSMSRLVGRLVKDAMIKKQRKRCVLTQVGKKEAERIT